jgi:hypothetical protein
MARFVSKAGWRVRRKLAVERICYVCDQLVPQELGVYDKYLGILIHRGACDNVVARHRRSGHTPRQSLQVISGLGPWTAIELECMRTGLPCPSVTR